MATPKTSKRTIDHAVFYYADPDNPKVERNAFRGQTVDLLPDDIKRGESYDPPAFTAEVDVVPTPAALIPDFPAVAADQSGWLAATPVNDIVTYVNEHPSVRDEVLVAEQARGDQARTELLQVLTQQQDE